MSSWKWLPMEMVSHGWRRKKIVSGGEPGRPVDGGGGGGGD